jgi:hypothetical protein
VRAAEHDRGPHAAAQADFQTRGKTPLWPSFDTENDEQERIRAVNVGVTPEGKSATAVRAPTGFPKGIRVKKADKVRAKCGAPLGNSSRSYNS